MRVRGDENYIQNFNQKTQKKKLGDLDAAVMIIKCMFNISHLRTGDLHLQYSGASGQILTWG
jgi:hypothetical protein